MKNKKLIEKLTAALAADLGNRQLRKLLETALKKSK